jgi:hypothetical protein
MGTWGDGLYDSDGALDTIAALTEVGAPADAATLAARVGATAWLDPSGVACCVDELRAKARAVAGIEALPEGTRASLTALLADPEGHTRGGSRTPAVQAALGGYCDGPRIDPLVRFAGAQPVIEGLGERAARVVDAALAPSSRGLDEVAAPLAGLGVVVELAQAGLWRPGAARVAAWRDGFAAADRRTRDERGFWDRYAGRVRLALELAGAGGR